MALTKRSAALAAVALLVVVSSATKLESNKNVKVVDSLHAKKLNTEKEGHKTEAEKPRVVSAVVVDHLEGKKHRGAGTGDEEGIHKDGIPGSVQPDDKDWATVSSNYKNATGVLTGTPEHRASAENHWEKVSQNFNDTGDLSSGSQSGTTGPAAAAKNTSPRVVNNEVAKKVLSFVDKKGDPCHDFYEYACGGWAEQTPLPSDQSEWGLADSATEAIILEQVRSELEANENDPAGIFYGSCMDTVSIASSGTKALVDIFKMIDKIKTVSEFSHVVGLLHRLNVNVIFDWGVQADEKHPDIDLFHMGQDGLSLPDKSYYSDSSDEGQKLRSEFVAHVSKMLQLVGVKEDEAVAAGYDVLDLEVAIASVSMNRDDMRDPEVVYNRYAYSDLKNEFPSFDWSVYATTIQPSNFNGVRYGEVNGPSKSGLMETLLQERALGNTVGHDNAPRAKDLRNTDVVIDAPSMLKNATALFKEKLEKKPHAAKFYLLFHLVSDYAEYLPEAYEKERFNFFGVKVNGMKEQKPRWKRCVLRTADAVSEALGRLYVSKYFSADTKTAAAGVLEGIEDAMRDRIKALEWMDDDTRQRALAKLGMVGNKVGFPDKWEDYSRLGLGKVLVKNVLAATVYEVQRQFKTLGIKGDKKRWDMGVYEVNAYYDPSNNEMVFPAGILRPPMFDASMPDAFNYGGIGATMGHELTHGFDDQGARFNGTGYLVMWWKNNTFTEFQKRTKCVEEEYSDFLYRPGKHEDGKLTLGENIADNGGTKLAYHAFKVQEARNGPVSIEGYTPEQLFFLAYGQGWCTKQRVKSEVKQVTSDEHSLARFRVLGVVKNMKEFADAFQCPVGSPMNPAKKCAVW